MNTPLGLSYNFICSFEFFNWILSQLYQKFETLSHGKIAALQKFAGGRQVVGSNYIIKKGKEKVN
jgi:hypothetical protein